MKRTIVLGVVAMCTVLMVFDLSRGGGWYESYTPSSCTAYEDSLLVDYQIDDVPARVVLTPDNVYQEGALEVAKWDDFERVIFWLAPSHGDVEDPYYLVYDTDWTFMVAIQRECFRAARMLMPKGLEVWTL